MSEYSMPSYFQTMPVIGKEVAHFSEENAAQIQEVEQEIHEIREAALEAGKSTEALNESGQWTAMQRIEELVDEGTWCPLNSLYNPQDNDNGSVGIVKGLGRINGKWAVIIASDNKNNNIRYPCSTGTPSRESLMAWSIDKGNLLTIDNFLISTDFLGD